MAAGNTLVADHLLGNQAYGEEPASIPAANGSGGMFETTAMSSDDSDRVAHWVAFLVLASLATLILIRMAGLQGMIAIGRS